MDPPGASAWSSTRLLGRHHGAGPHVASASTRAAARGNDAELRIRVTAAPSPRPRAWPRRSGCGRGRTSPDIAARPGSPPGPTRLVPGIGTTSSPGPAARPGPAGPGAALLARDRLDTRRPAGGCGRSSRPGSRVLALAGHRRGSRRALIRAGQKAPPERRIRHEPIPSPGRRQRLLGRLPVSSEYSICTAPIGWTACARRIVAGEASDRPSTGPCPAGPAGPSRRPCPRSALGIDPVLVVEVDKVDAQPLEAPSHARRTYSGRP